MAVRRARVQPVWGLLGIAVALAGCGKTGADSKPGNKTPEPTGVETTGPRLVPWQLEAAGTTPLVVGIFDKKLAEHCSFVADRDGTLRCLPLPATAVELQANFADATCEQRIYYAPYAKNAQSLLGHNVAVPLPTEACETRYAVGTLKEIPKTQRYYRSDTGCSPSAPPAQDEGSHNFVLDQEADPKAWVSATEVDGPLLGERLRLRRFETSNDGSFDAGFVDQRWDMPCSLTGEADELECAVASLPESTQYFTDSECMADGLWPVATCPKPAYIGKFNLPEDRYALGELWDGPIFSRSKRCEPADTSYEGQEGFLLRGERLTDVHAPTAWTNAGTGRLRLMGLLADDGSMQVLSDGLFGSSSLLRYAYQPRFYDSQLDTSCKPIWTSNAGVRCVPPTTLVDPYTYLMFADAECTEPAYLCSLADCSFTDLVVTAYDENGEYRALSRRALVSLQGKETFSLYGTVCMRNEPVETPLFLRGGAELPWDEYPQLTETNGRASGAK